MDKIIIKGAREHNLKGIGLELPKNKFIVFTGLSGSGKSSLAFDTIYAEGQRRYVESLSTYARQFLGMKGKPEVEYIEGLSPAIAIQQRVLSHNPRSIVGTITEIYDHFRILFARVGIPYCPNDNIPVTARTVDEIAEEIMKLPDETKLFILSPIVRSKKGQYKELFEEFKKKGYVRIRIDGEMLSIEETAARELEKNKKHNIDLVIDRLVIKNDIKTRLYDSLALSFKESGGLVSISLQNGKFADGSAEKIFSQRFFCPECGWSIPELSPRVFSFNSPYGACPSCDGLGFVYSVSPDMMARDGELTLSAGLFSHIPGLGSENFASYIIKLAAKQGLDLKKSFEKMNKKEKEFLFWGEDGVFEGVANIIERRFRETQSQAMRDWYMRFFTKTPCRTCKGKRLKDDVLSVRIEGKNIWDLTSMSVEELCSFFKHVSFKGANEKIAHPVLTGIRTRLNFLKNVGLSYISLDRTIDSLSGGEMERIRLATQLGTRLTGVIYIMDEPTIGLHPRDTSKLLESLTELRDIGNTVIVVEHDRDTIETADWIVDLGPGSGIHGGRIVYEGELKGLRSSRSLTGLYMSGRKDTSISRMHTDADTETVKVYGAEEFNLKRISVGIPLNRFVCITGVSGAGKSTLMDRIFYQGLLWEKGLSSERPGKYAMFENQDKVVEMKYISQDPIGRMSKSNIATYTKVFDHIRDIYAELPASKTRGFTKSVFSFNVKGGRCEACQGDGVKKIEMHFLPDVYVKCDICEGKRFNKDTLEVKYRDKNISDVLDITVEEAYDFFKNIPYLKRKLKLLMDVGLSYIQLGQPAPTLSGGEAQRIKLARELSKKTNKGTLYFMDEPTTGLHFEDTARLLSVIEKIRDQGNTVVVIEHNPDVIKNADWIIDLGPEGGDGGGFVLACGTVEEIIACPRSHTGAHLKKYIKKEA